MFLFFRSFNKLFKCPWIIFFANFYFFTQLYFFYGCLCTICYILECYWLWKLIIDWAFLVFADHRCVHAHNVCTGIYKFFLHCVFCKLKMIDWFWRPILIMVLFYAQTIIYFSFWKWLFYFTSLCKCFHVWTCDKSR